MVKDIAEDDDSNPIFQRPVIANGVMLFTPYHPDFGLELWKSDGTDEGTVLVKDIVTGPGTPGIFNLVSNGDVVFFAAATP